LYSSLRRQRNLLNQLQCLVEVVDDWRDRVAPERTRVLRRQGSKAGSRLLFRRTGDRRLALLLLGHEQAWNEQRKYEQREIALRNLFFTTEPLLVEHTQLFQQET